MSDAKPRTSLRSYWHTLPKKKEQTPLKTGVRSNKAISVHLLTEPYVDVTAHTAPSQQAVSFPLQGMEVWMNRHQIKNRISVFLIISAITCMIRASLSQKPTDRPLILPLQHLVIFDKIITSPLLECFCRFRKFHSGSGRE